MKVVAFNGSARAQGNTQIMLQTALDELQKEGIETELIALAGLTLSGCRGCGTCGRARDRRCAIPGDPLNDYIQKMAEADGILLGSPTYFADVTANMKALIERAGYVSRSNGDLFKRKVGAAVVAVRRGGGIHTFDSMNHFFTIGQMIIVGSTYWNLGIGREAGAVSQDAEGMATMQNLGRNMAWLLKKIAG